MSKGAFAIDATWPEPPATDARDVAHISIRLDDYVFTRLTDFELNQQRDFVRGSAVSLAFWLADNWWRLRYESLSDNSYPSAHWRLRHELTSAAGGSLWPPLMIHSTGSRMLIGPAAGRTVDLGPVRYVGTELKSVETDAYELGVDRFLHLVSDTCANASDGKVLATLLSELDAEREDPDTHAWRRLEARLGYDPDTAPSALMKAMGGLEGRVGEANLQEAALAEPGKDAPRALERALEAANDSEVEVRLEVAEGVSRTRIRDRAAPPWKLAREAAHQVREAAQLDDGRMGAGAFQELFGITAKSLAAPGTARNLPYAAHLRAKGSERKVALQSANQRDRRFELACVLGDRIWSESDFGVISKAKTDRQKFQRAFAQNLLVPYADLRKLIDETAVTERQIEAAARHFHVHPQVVRRLLVLEGILSEPTVEERLEAA